MYNTYMCIDVFFYFFIFTMIVSLDIYADIHMTAHGRICTFILTATYISYIPAGEAL